VPLTPAQGTGLADGRGEWFAGADECAGLLWATAAGWLEAAGVPAVPGAVDPGDVADDRAADGADPPERCGAAEWLCGPEER